MQSIESFSLELLMLTGTIAILIILGFVLLSVVLLKEKQYLLLQSKVEAERNFKKDLLAAQIESCKSTIDELALEIHDNLGQRISLAKLYLSMIARESSALRHRSEASINLMDEMMLYVRDIKKFSSSDFFYQNGLIMSIENTLAQISDASSIKTEFRVLGRHLPLGEHVQYVLLRIFQEAVNNAIKHSNCRNLLICLEVNKDKIEMRVEDDGVGFDFDSVDISRSSGLRSMAKRAELCGGSLSFNRTDERTILTINTKNYD
jgi:signal transduction histidine kinase